MIRAKMHCDTVIEQKFGPSGAQTKTGEEVRLNAVYGKDGSSNAQWAQATPSGNVYLWISNPAAWGSFTAGKFYFLDIAETTEEG